ncbi:M67 family metallopeptidase [Brevibacillus centrosporus]|uniref:M67 family metallopeptidase n=1 Tax=Brevibacillus centrosporus TaxID=54910 RepID=UPI002E1A94C0|nr:M67 family metallopeptidase [Brevibacillus centrosporus]
MDVAEEGAARANPLENALPISKRVWREMLNHCLAEKPFEACGLISGRYGRAETLWRMVNVDRTPDSFAMDSRQIQQVFQMISKRGEQLVGIYHSHPTTPPYPSKEDIAYASYTDVAYMILSLAGPQPALGCFNIRGMHAIPQRFFIC